MQVIIQPDPVNGKTQSPVELAALSGQQVMLEGYSLESFGEVQVQKFLRGAGQKALDRKNEGTRFQFSVLKTFSTAMEAETWFRQHRRNTPKSGTLMLLSGGGGLISVDYIHDATITSIRQDSKGTSSIITYTIEGGPITST